ncbi:MAG: ABC transporter permease [Alphaproteobacteria bacterium]|jgi:putative spermidine/putrescine transport system permease protein|nr:ABC transporter permease [Alphaproteobacteria bacterium]MDP6813908.1 ABC transporter permease [Alphaproteobacteria bacterium]
MQDFAQAQHSGLIGGQPVGPSQVAEARKTRREVGFPVGWLVAPATLWLLVFLVLPLISIIVFSFWTSAKGGLVPDLTLQYYAGYFYNEGFFDQEHRNFLTLSVFIRTLGSTFYFTAVVMVLCLIVGYPIAYFLAMQVQSFKWQMALFLVCMVPFWTSYLIRAVAWLPMLGRRGLLNSLLINLDIVDKPVSFLLYSEFGYTMALVQIYVVLCVGPIFFSLSKIDPAILEAARDMGATPFQIFREIIGPLSLPGVAIGMIFIFVILMGEFATAVVVYGGKTSTTGTVILNYYAIANYPFAAVNALMLMLSMMIGVVVILRIVDIRKEL